jgi:hypothetical protein
MNDHDLMAKIKTTCGPFIDEAVAGTPYPAAFLAALTANESGGDPAATRFESSVLGQLVQVLIMRKSNFGAIDETNIVKYLRKTLSPNGSAAAVPPLDLGLVALVNLATSYGPTQIMGYQALAGGFDLGELSNLGTHYKHAIDMLDDFARRFELAADAGMALFFHCWNAGSPAGRTFDPQYTSNGLSRMAIYQTL